MGKWIVLAALAAIVGSFASSCKPSSAAQSPKTDTVFSVYKLAHFFAYPVNERQPRFLDTGKPADDSLAYKMRLQHWYLLFETKKYEKLYGPLPQFYPGNVSLDEYKKHPTPVPSEYNAIMFGD